MRISTLRFATILSLTLGLSAQPLTAQLCLGRPVSQPSPVRIGARYILNPGASSQYGLELGAVANSGIFGSATLAASALGGDRGTLRIGELSLGQVISGRVSALVICPLAGVQYLRPPSTEQRGITIDSHQLTYSLGASLGMPFAVNPSLDLVPFGGTYFQRHQYNASGGGTSMSVSTNTGLYELGVVLVANRRFSIGPVMRNVFGTNYKGRPGYGLVTSFSFGW